MSFHSPLLGSISDAQFDAALDRFELGAFIAAEPTNTGLFGQNVFLTSASGDWVLRGRPHFDWQFPKERFFARVLYEHGAVPVPWPYLYDPCTDIFGWSYVIMPCLPGVRTAEEAVWANLPYEDQRGIVHALGDTLANMHTLTWPHAGEYDLSTDSIQPLRVAWYEHVTANLTLRAWAQRYLDEASEILSRIG